MRRRSTTVVIIEGIHDAGLASRIYARVTDTLARVSPPPAVAKIILAGEHRPKGGVDTRCTIRFHVPRRRDLTVTELGNRPATAFDAAHAALDLSVTRESERHRELVRRPKKYFLAKRLLAPDTALEAPDAAAATSRTRRARRRRVA